MAGLTNRRRGLHGATGLVQFAARTNEWVTPMPPDFLLRAARLSDAEAIAALHCLPGFRHGTLRPPFVSPQQVRERLERPFNGHMLVAFAGEALIGQVSVAQHSGRKSHAGEIGIGIHDDWVGQGIGHRLMSEIITVADRWMGLRRLELTVQTDNARAITLYKRHGFVIEGTHIGDSIRDGVLIDVHSMARLVAPAVLQRDVT